MVTVPMPGKAEVRITNTVVKEETIILNTPKSLTTPKKSHYLISSNTKEILATVEKEQAQAASEAEQDEKEKEWAAKVKALEEEKAKLTIDIEAANNGPVMPQGVEYEDDDE